MVNLISGKAVIRVNIICQILNISWLFQRSKLIVSHMIVGFVVVGFVVGLGLFIGAYFSFESDTGFSKALIFLRDA